jgi:hypothetical protein
MMDAMLLAKSGEAVKSGPIWFAAVLLLAIACYFLFKSMSKHLRTVRENFPDESAPPPPAQAPTPVVQPGEPAQLSESPAADEPPPA